MNKVRRNMLFVPGNSAGMFKDVISIKPDTVMFDLEDSIDVNEKDAARELTKLMINKFNYQKFDIEVAVRINHFSTPFYKDDLWKIVGQSSVDMIRLPKVETKEDVLKVVTDLEEIENKINRKNPVILFCAIESALGVLNAYQIATAHPRVKGIALGGVDYLLDLNAIKTTERKEILFARQMILHAARAAKIDAFDCVFTKTGDLDGLRTEAQFVKELGFTGKSALHPNQVIVINEVFSPSTNEIADAEAIITAYEKFKKQKKGVFVVDGQMVDKPVINKAERILALAKLQK